jgi:amino acid adenylation domain-containing protein
MLAGVSPVVCQETGINEMLVDERNYLSSEKYATARKYWAKRLESYEGGHFARATSLANRRMVLSLTEDEMTALQKWTAVEKVTEFHFFAAVLHVTLFRLVAARDLTIGLPILNRRTAREKQTVGLFLGFCVLRTSPALGSGFSDLVKSIGAQLKADFRHQRYPLETLANETGSLPFEVSLSYEKHDYNSAFTGTSTIVTPLRTPVQSYPLKVFIRDFDTKRPIFIDFDVNNSCFGDLDPEMLVSTFQSVMREALDDRDTGLIPAPVMEPSRQAPAALHTDLCSVFERVAAQHPASVAVQGDSGTLTYAALEARANALAWSLRERGAGPEMRIGVCGGRDIHFVVGMLAVLKTGAAYIPLDPAYPADRLAFLIADSGMIALVGSAAELEHMPASDLPRCTIDLQDAADPGRGAPPRQLCAAQAAYVIYTSGSTGTPKGCIVTHANLLRLFDATGKPFGLSSSDVWSVFHSTAFDFSVWEIWGALLHGARAVFVPYETSRDPQAFAEFLRMHRVSVLSQTPSAFRLLDGQPGMLPELRLVVFGGEALATASLRDWFRRYGDQRPRMVNMYGITETTVHVTARTLRREDADRAHASPIGQPLADLSLQILDRHGQATLPGVAGEIHVGGPGVARGYLNRPGLTAARFVPDPDGPPGSRRYRAGDLARRRADQEIEYLGRADQQIKIRGFRIEPGEIEAAIRRHPAVRDVAVICDQDARGAARLVAYVTHTSTDDPGTLPGTLRERLGASLPAHMVPAHFVTLAALPLTHNGKLDRRALPAPRAAHDDATHEPPVTPTEQLLADIWGRVLNCTPGRNDSFFALGGDSINSLRALNETRQATGLDLPLQGIFSAPTLRAFAAWIDGIAACPRDADTPASPRVRRAARQRATISLEPEGSHFMTRNEAP